MKPESPSMDEVSVTSEAGESSLVVLTAEGTDEKLGVQIAEDGTLQLGTWDAEGVWIDLVTCTHDSFNLYRVPLNQYPNEL